MSKLVFTPHTGFLCPVPPDAYVVYRTSSQDPNRVCSHIHLPTKAKELVWTDKPNNRILEYAVVKTPKFPTNLKPIFSFAEIAKINAMRERIKQAVVV